METKQSKYRFSDDTLGQIDWLAEVHGLESRADLIRYAVAKLYREQIKKMENNSKNFGKLA